DKLIRGDHRGPLFPNPHSSTFNDAINIIQVNVENIEPDNGIAIGMGIDAALAAAKFHFELIKKQYLVKNLSSIRWFQKCLPAILKALISSLSDIHRMSDNISLYPSPSTPILKSIILGPENREFAHEIVRQSLMLPAGSPLYKDIIRGAVHIVGVWILSVEEERPRTYVSPFKIYSHQLVKMMHQQHQLQHNYKLHHLQVNIQMQMYILESGSNVALLGILTLVLGQTWYVRQIIATTFAVLWGARLGCKQYNLLLLFIFLNSPRISNDEYDGRDVKFGRATDVIGVFVFIIGILFESISDFQKIKLYLTNTIYEDRTLVVETGIFLLCLQPIITGIGTNATYASITSPVFTIFLLMFLSGMPLNERPAHEKQWKQGNWNDYSKYLERTS
ncbi:3546_t:CDS:10, partial [Funneliformis mosseae]